jgi:drug/metabolite transporter (DMT)-like permease
MLKRYYSAAILSTLCLLSIGIFVRALSSSVALPLITFYRAFVAFLFLLLIVPFVDKQFWRVNWNDVKEYAVVGFFLALTMTCFNTALTLSPLTDVYFLNYIHVFLAPIIATILLRERFTRKNIILTLAGFVGIALINPFSGTSIAGNFWALGAGISYALMTVFARKLDKDHSLGDVVWFMGFASLFLLPFALQQHILSIPSNDWPTILAMGILSTGMGYLFYNAALHRLRVHLISMVDLIITTIGTILLSVFFFGEPLPALTLVGGIIVMMVGLLFAVEAHLLDEGLKLPSPAKSAYGTRKRKAKSRRNGQRRPRNQ